MGTSMSLFGGILVVVLISIVAGGIAYVGDRVGHAVGRKRLSLFGLRPRHTSTIFAIGTGMLIALTVTIFAIAVSSYVKTAFFRLSELNDRILALQAEAVALDRHTHDEKVVVNHGDLMNAAVLILRPEESPGQRYLMLTGFFDDTIRNVNSVYGPSELGSRALRPNTARSRDPETFAKLRELLTDVEPALLSEPVLIFAVADRNLFPHDPIHFTLEGLPDRRIFHAGQVVASLPIRGSGVNAQVAINQLTQAVSSLVEARGWPDSFATPLSETSPAAMRALAARISRGGGAAVLEARAATDIYPHLGGLPLTFSLTTSRR
jgi:hypothetical protein